MKKSSFLIGLLCALVGCSQQRDPRVDQLQNTVSQLSDKITQLSLVVSNENKRFQLIPATYDSTVVDNGATNQEQSLAGSTLMHGVFKIDTQTGQVWVYSSGAVINTNGTITSLNGWKEIKGL